MLIPVGEGSMHAFALGREGWQSGPCIGNKGTRKRGGEGKGEIDK